MAEYQCGRDCAPCGACRNPRAREISRRDFLLRLVGGCVALSGVGSALAACAPLAGDDSAETEADTPSESTPAVAVAPEMTVLPTAEGAWTLEATVNGSAPQGTGKIQIADVGKFSFDARDVETVRTDIFRPGHFSLFDILVHLGVVSLNS